MPTSSPSASLPAPQEPFLSAQEALTQAFKQWRAAWSAVFDLHHLPSYRHFSPMEPESVSNLEQKLKEAQNHTQHFLLHLQELQTQSSTRQGLGFTPHQPFLMDIWIEGCSLLHHLSDTVNKRKNSGFQPLTLLYDAVQRRLDHFPLFEADAARVAFALVNTGLLLPVLSQTQLEAQQKPQKSSSDPNENAYFERVALFALSTHSAERLRQTLRIPSVLESLSHPKFLSSSFADKGWTFRMDEELFPRSLGGATPSTAYTTATHEAFSFLGDKGQAFRQSRIDRGDAALQLLIDQGLFRSGSVAHVRDWVRWMFIDLRAQPLSHLSSEAFGHPNASETLMIWNEFLDKTRCQYAQHPAKAFQRAQECLAQLQRLKLDPTVWRDFDAFVRQVFAELQQQLPPPDAATQRVYDAQRRLNNRSRPSTSKTKKLELSAEDQERVKTEQHRQAQLTLQNLLLVTAFRRFSEFNFFLGRTLGATKSAQWIQSVVTHCGARPEQPGLALVMMGVVAGSNTPPARRQTFLAQQLALMDAPPVFTWTQWALIQREDLCRRVNVLQELAQAGTRLQMDNALWMEGASNTGSGQPLHVSPMELEVMQVDSSSVLRLEALSRMGAHVLQRSPMDSHRIGMLGELAQSAHPCATPTLEWAFKHLDIETLDTNARAQAFRLPDQTPLVCLAARALMPDTLRLLHTVGADFTAQDAKGHGAVRWMARRSGKEAQARMEPTLLALQEGGVNWLEKDHKETLAIGVLARKAPSEALQTLARLCPDAFSERGRSLAPKRTSKTGGTKASESANDVLARRGDGLTLGLVEQTLLQNTLESPAASTPLPQAPENAPAASPSLTRRSRRL